MSHDPFAGRRRNAKRRQTANRPAARTDAVPGHADEMIAWIDAAPDETERRQRARLVIQAEKDTASPRRDVIEQAQATLGRTPRPAPGAKRRNTQPDPTPPAPPDLTGEVPEKAREIVAWLRDAPPDEATARARAAQDVETRRHGTPRATVAAQINKAL